MENPPEQAYLMGILAAMLVIFVVVFIFAVIPLIITNWQLYKKAGKPGWASIIPVYNNIVMAEIGNKPMWMGVAVGVSSIGASLFSIIGSGDSPVEMLFSSISGLISLVSFVLSIFLLIGFIKAYQANTSFWVCYFLLPIAAVFMVKNVTYRGISPVPNLQGYAQPTYPQYPITGQQYPSPQPTPVAQPQFQQPQTQQPQVPQQPVQQPVQQPAQQPPVNDQPPTSGPFAQQ